MASLPLSDLWNTETEENDNEKALETNLTSFGDDYSKYLHSETETSSDPDIFSDFPVMEFRVTKRRRHRKR